MKVVAVRSKEEFRFKMKIVLGVGLLMLTLVASGYAQEKASPVLDRLMDEFVAAFDAKNMTALASLYAEDAVWMPPNVPMIKV